VRFQAVLASRGELNSLYTLKTSKNPHSKGLVQLSLEISLSPFLALTSKSPAALRDLRLIEQYSSAAIDIGAFNQEPILRLRTTARLKLPKQLIK
jgi:hypothetical protein